MNKIKIKYCGMKRIEDVVYAIELGVDYLGFIVEVENSKRKVSMEEFQNIVNYLKENNLRDKVKIVAVIVDMPEEQIEQLLKIGDPDTIQFHGEESTELLQKYKGKIEIFKAFKGSATDEKQIKRYKNIADRILLDSMSAKEKSAEVQSEKFNAINLFKKLKNKYSLILAGGLNGDNIDYYLNELEPEFVDVSSCIEDNPGIKSKIKMKNLFDKIKNYG